MLKLAPVFNEATGYLELDPNPTHVFTLSIQIIYAEDLSKLVLKSHQHSCAAPFYFSFDLGIRVDLDSFEDLSRPNFPPDTFFFKLAGEPKTIQALFSGHTEPLKLSLMCEDNKEVSSVRLPLAVFSIPSIERLMIDNFKFKGVVHFENALNCSRLTNQPRVGYSLELRLDKRLEPSEYHHQIMASKSEDQSNVELMQVSDIDDFDGYQLKKLISIEEFEAKGGENWENSCKKLDNYLSNQIEDFKEKLAFLETFDKALKTKESLLDAKEKELDCNNVDFQFSHAFQTSAKKKILFLKEEKKALMNELSKCKKLYEEAQSKLIETEKFKEQQCDRIGARQDEHCYARSRTSQQTVMSASSNRRNVLLSSKSILLSLGYPSNATLISKMDDEIRKLQVQC